MSLDQGPDAFLQGKEGCAMGSHLDGKPCTTFKRLRSWFLFFSGATWPGGAAPPLLPQFIACWLTIGVGVCAQLLAYPLVPVPHSDFLVFYSDKALERFSEPSST